MRSKLITVVTGVASMLLVAQVAAADAVQEQLRLMEQRMAEMEDRLSSTSNQLEAAEAKLEQRDATLVEHGLLEEDESALRSGVGDFVEMVDVTGVVAASYNHRLIKAGDAGLQPGSGQGNDLFKNPNSNTFQLDQVWLTLDKAPTEESRGGFHVEFVTGTSTVNQGQTNTSESEPYLYSGYVSYLAPVGNGIQVDIGKLPTVLGAEVVQTNGNFFVTQGAVFGLQPVVYNGVSFATQITDELGFTAGVVNDVYSDTDVSLDNDKAYFGQFSYSGDAFGLNVGGIIGDSDAGECGLTRAGGSTLNSADCQVSVVDVVLTADPTDNLSLWLNYDWVHVSGDDSSGHGDKHGISGAGRFAINDDMGISTRVEYIWEEDTIAGFPSAADDSELLTVTGTFDRTLAEGLVGRLELRYDTFLETAGGANGFTLNGNAAGTNNDQLVAIAQMYYEF